MKTIMTQAHRIAKTLTGDYAARLSEALKIAWKKYRSVLEIESAFTEISKPAYINSYGYEGHYVGD